MLHSAILLRKREKSWCGVKGVLCPDIMGEKGGQGRNKKKRGEKERERERERACKS